MINIDVDKQIAKELILAQVASDGGKLNKEIRHLTKTSYITWKEGYKSKVRHILNAIMLINKLKGKSAFKYQVLDNNQNWIVVFETKINKKSYQMSFHTFSYDIGKFSYHKPNKKYIKINRYIYSNSRYTAIRLAGLYKIGRIHNWL